MEYIKGEPLWWQISDCVRVVLGCALRLCAGQGSVCSVPSALGHAGHSAIFQTLCSVA
jgi:hypothetical protein